IVEMTNPDIEQAVKNAKVQMESASAQLANSTSNLDQQVLSQKNSVASAKSQMELAKVTLEADQGLLKQGIQSALVVQRDQVAFDSATGTYNVATQALESLQKNREQNLAPQRAAVDIAKAAYETAMRQLDDLHVKAPMSGQLQMLAANIEEGAQIGPGGQIARASNPSRLKAQIRISETQTRDLAVGQKAEIDTRPV